MKKRWGEVQRWAGTAWGFLKRGWWAVGLAAIAVGVAWMGYLSGQGYVWAEWTGLGAYTVDAKLQRGKTLWDIADIVGIPVFLVIIGWSLQQAAQRKADEKKSQLDREVAEKEAESAREIMLNQQRETVLQQHFNEMTNLLLHENLRGSAADTEVRVIARVKTLSALRMIDHERKGVVIRFLYEAQLITGEGSVIGMHEASLMGIELVGTPFPDINLAYANLKNAKLEKANLIEAKLMGTRLEMANLAGAYLLGANLQEAYLMKANLCGTYLLRANLRGSYLLKADLEMADLEGADLVGANLAEANLRGTILKGANLEGAILVGANLVEANLRGAILKGANLEAADLEGADLEGADLEGANLYRAKLCRANLFLAFLERADLKMADLMKANLGMATLNGALLSGAKLEGVKGLTDEMMIAAGIKECQKDKEGEG